MIDYRAIGIDFKIPVYYCDQFWNELKTSPRDFFKKIKQNHITLIDLTIDAMSEESFKNTWAIFERENLKDQVFFLVSDFSKRETKNTIWFPFWFYNFSWWEQSKPQISTITNPRKFKLSCLNRCARSQRVYTFYHLLQKKYFTQSIISHQCHIDTFTQEPIFLHDKRFDDIPGEIREKIQEFDLYCTTPDNTESWINHNDHRVDGLAFQDTYLNIVTETSIHPSPVISFTEKTAKPLGSCQLFTIVGNQNATTALEYLGFDCFWGDLDQHSYETDSCWMHRIDRMFDIIDKKYDYLEEIYFQNRRGLVHNHNWIFSEEFRKKLLDPLKKLDFIA